MSETREVYDLTIIGGGPAGLFSAFYAGIRQAKTKIIDSLPQLGGQLAALYPEKLIYDIPGFPAIKAHDFVAQLQQQLEPFSHTVCLEQEVLHIEKVQDVLHIQTAQETHYSKAVILALGNGSFQPRRLLLDGVADFEGKSIHYHVENLQQFAGKNVAIAGGGDSAIDWALMLTDIANEVALIHRRDAFRGHEHSVHKLEQSDVVIYKPYIIEELLVQSQQLKGVQLKSTKGENKKQLFFDDLIVNYGFTSSLQHLKEWGLHMTGHAIDVASDMSTNLSGVYAVGDIAAYQGKVKLIATGLGEAPTAVNNALHAIHPNLRTQPAHSTSLFSAKHTP